MGEINSGDTAFVLISAALVALMTPGLAFFYGGLVRRRNFLTILMQVFICMGIVTFLWVAVGYSLSFSGNSLGASSAISTGPSCVASGRGQAFGHRPSLPWRTSPTRRCSPSSPRP